VEPDEVGVRVQHDHAQAGLEQQPLDHDAQGVGLAGPGLAAEEGVPVEAGGVEVDRDLFVEEERPADLERRSIRSRGLQITPDLVGGGEPQDGVPERLAGGRRSDGVLQQLAQDQPFTGEHAHADLARHLHGSIVVAQLDPSDGAGANPFHPRGQDLGQQRREALALERHVAPWEEAGGRERRLERERTAVDR
jgi:hypothetical protein